MSLKPLSINVASDPFRRERAQNAALAIACIALLCTLFVITGMVLRARSQASSIRAEIANEQLQLDNLRAEQTRYQGVLSRPSNAGVFSRSVFLNELIARRGVSWTRVFDDLSTVMPPTIRIEAIRLPQVPAQDASGVNRIQLDMVIGADHPDSVLKFLRHLQDSPLFGSATVVNQQPPAQNDPLFKFRLTVAYAQKL